MNIHCFFCKKELALFQREQKENTWNFNRRDNCYALQETVHKESIICKYCKTEIDPLHLAGIGMYHHIPKRNIGSGTNFYQVYAADPVLYDAFSRAEDKEGVIYNIVLSASQHGKTMLDVGCGTGKYAHMFSSSFEKIYALDISKSLLSYARENSTSNNIEYILTSADTIPLLDESVDIIISTWGSFSPNETVPEMKRVLKKNGIILRVGTMTRDDLTNLYAKFDEAYIQSSNKYFEEVGFISEKHEILVSFDTLEDAKRILSGITGALPEQITSPLLHHKIIIQTYKKTS